MKNSKKIALVNGKQRKQNISRMVMLVLAFIVVELVSAVLMETALIKLGMSGTQVLLAVAGILTVTLGASFVMTPFRFIKSVSPWAKACSIRTRKTALNVVNFLIRFDIGAGVFVIGFLMTKLGLKGAGIEFSEFAHSARFVLAAVGFSFAPSFMGCAGNFARRYTCVGAAIESGLSYER